MKHTRIHPLLFLLLFLFGFASPGEASRFALFALDIQVPFEETQSLGEVRKAAIARGLQEAVEEATYKIIPGQGLDTTYQRLKSNIFDKARRFVPQYKILGEKQFPGTFDLSLQVTVDTVLLRRALLKLGLLKVAERGATEEPVTLKVQNLINGKVLLELMDFFHQRPDLAENFRLARASHGTFTFSFLPFQSPNEIVSQILYHAPVPEGTFDVVKQGKDLLILRFHPVKPS